MGIRIGIIWDMITAITLIKKKKPFYENIFSFNDHISPEYDCLIGLGLV